MDMSMKPTDDGTPRAHLLRLPFAVEVEVDKGPSTLPAANPHAVAYPVRKPYTDSQYSETTVPLPDQHVAIQSVDGATANPSAPPWGDCQFPHAMPEEETKSAALMPIHLPKPKLQHRPFSALSSCCSTSRPHTPPATATVQAPSHTHSEEDVSDLNTPPAQPHVTGTCCSGSHCSSEDSSLKHLGDTSDSAILTEHEDLELGPPNFERVLLRIDGLKCGCCESGLSRAVSRIPAIRNFQVNTVLARVELELDTNRLSVDKVIELLGTRTGYKFEEQVTIAGQVLEFIITDPRRLQHAIQPNGVTRVEVPERAPWRPFGLLSGRKNTTPKKTSSANGNEELVADVDNKPDVSIRAISKVRIPPTRIYYDATVIGARDIYEHYLKYDPDLTLAPLVADPGLDLGAKQTRRALKWFLPTLAFTIPVLVFTWAPVNHDNPNFAHISLALATIVQLIAFKEFVPNAMRSLYHSHVFEMDFLVAFSTTMAYIFSVVSYAFQIKRRPLETGSFFETSTLLVTLILLGRVINEFARYRAAKSVSFRSLQIDDAILVQHTATTTSWSNAQTKKIDNRLLQYGDVFRVPPHTRIVTDGVVVYGGSNVDESMITGEFKPNAKGLDSEVFAGTTNGDGQLIVSLTKLPHENCVQRIAALVEDAELTKPRAQALADRVAGWFVPAMASIGLTVFLIRLFVERYRNKNTWRSAALRAITYAIATLIVSCPCAIGLAVPMVVLIAGGVAARYGIIFRDPQKLEIARNVTDVVFDKTGTITTGRLEVVGVPLYRNSDQAVMKGLLLGLVKDIRHPVSIAIAQYLERDRFAHKNFEPLEVKDITSVPGKGVQGTCAKSGKEIRAGNAEWLHVNVIGQETNTACYFTYDGDLRISFEFMDRPRAEAIMVVKELHARGLKVHMLSGDNDAAVNEVAATLYIPPEHTKARCNPEGKMNYIRDLQEPGKAIVMFLGDGTNDSAALKQAHVGVHLNEGSDVAKSAADVVLMTTRLHDVLILLDISFAAYRRICWNFSWSGFYNIVAILLAAGAFVKLDARIRIQPQWAGLGELISVLPVVLIAFQMRWRNYGKPYRMIETAYQKVEAPKREQRRLRQSASSSSAGCCELPSSTLAHVDAITGMSEKRGLGRLVDWVSS